VALADTYLDTACAAEEDRLWGETVSIRRAAAVTTGIQAQWDQAERVETKLSITTTILDRVWQIRKTAYVISGVAAEPKAGDRIIESGGTEWEALPASVPTAVVDDGNYEWSIITKRIKV